MFKSKRFLLRHVVSSLSLLAWTASCHALSYQEAIDQAEIHASELKARQNSLTAAQQRQISAGELPDPKLVTGINNLPVQGEQAWSTGQSFLTMEVVGVRQEMTNGGKREAARHMAQANVSRADLELEVERLTIRRQTLLAWLKVYYAEQRYEVLDQLEAENRLQSLASTAQLAAAQSTAEESLQARSEAATLADRKDELVRDIATARIELSRWIGLAADQPLTGGPPPKLEPMEHLHHTLDKHPDIAVFEAQKASAQAAVDLAEAAKRPDWGVELDYEHLGPPFGDMVNVLFTIDLPIFTRTRQNPQIAAQRQELEQVAEERETMLRQHTMELETQLAEQTSLSHQIERVDQEWLPLSQEKLSLATAAYRSGKGSLTAVLEARRSILGIKMKRIDLEERRSNAETVLRYLSEEVQP